MARNIPDPPVTTSDSANSDSADSDRADSDRADLEVDGDVAAIADLFHQVNRRIRHARADRHRDGWVTPGQIRALRQLRLCGEPIRMSELAERLGIARRSATTVVDDLEGAGLVRRLPDPRDRRATLVELTDAGTAALRSAWELRRSAAASVLATLSPDELATLRSTLTKLTESVVSTGPPPRA